MGVLLFKRLVTREYVQSAPPNGRSAAVQLRTSGRWETLFANMSRVYLFFVGWVRMQRDNRLYHELPLSVLMLFVTTTFFMMCIGVLGTDFGSTFFWLTAVGTLFMRIGNMLPVVKDYLGGGNVLLLVVGSYATWANILPEKYVTATKDFMAGINFQAFYITLLIVGAVMAVERKTLLRSLAGYIPCILGGIIGAVIFGMSGGALLGLDAGEALMKYIMPVMGAGSAAGALPMSSIFAEVTGGDKNAYYSIAMSSVMIANVLCLFFAV